MAEYSVSFEARGDSPVPDDVIIRLAELLEPYHGTASGGAGTAVYGATFSVNASSAAEAVHHGTIMLAVAADGAALPGQPALARWPIVRVEAVHESVLEEELARPVLPDLVSGPEAAEILGVKLQRFHVIAGTHPGFPAPAYRGKGAVLWFRAGVERFNETWERKQGRPRKDRGAA